MSVCSLLSFACQRRWTPRIEPLTVAATSSIFCTKGQWAMDGDTDLAQEAMPRIPTAKRHKQHEDIAEVSEKCVWEVTSKRYTVERSRKYDYHSNFVLRSRMCHGRHTPRCSWRIRAALESSVRGCRRCRTVGLTMRDCWPAVELLVRACRFAAMQQRAMLCSSDFIHVENQNVLAKR